jgi:hypothetical protein
MTYATLMAEKDAAVEAVGAAPIKEVAGTVVIGKKLVLQEPTREAFGKDALADIITTTHPATGIDA